MYQTLTYSNEVHRFEKRGDKDMMQRKVSYNCASPIIQTLSANSL
jgi:hypothetical protein